MLLALLDRLDQLDLGIVEALVALPAAPEWTISIFLRQQVRARQVPPAGGFGGLLTRSLGDQLRDRLDLDPEALSLASDVEEPPQPSGPSFSALPVQALVDATLACLDAGGTLVADVASTDEHLTSMAQAVVRWASRTGERVLLVAADGAEMCRVARVVLPEARAGAGLDRGQLPIAELAERESYLCPHRWFGVARTAPYGPLAREVVHGLAKMVVWVRTSPTGLRTELALPGQEARAWELVRAGDEFADGWSTCAYRREGFCFAARAERRAETARIVVTTHAALAAHLAGRGTPFPEAKRVVVLQAAQFEEALRQEASASLQSESLTGLLDQLASTGSGGKRKGLLHLAFGGLESRGRQAHEGASFATVQVARDAVVAFYRALRGLLADSNTRAGAHHDGETSDPRVLRLDDHVRRLPAWRLALEAWHVLESALSDVVILARDAASAIHAAEGNKKPLASNGLAVEVLGVAARLDRAAEDGARMLTTVEDGRDVCWLQVPYPPSDDHGVRGGAARSSGAHAKPPKGASAQAAASGVGTSAEPGAVVDVPTEGMLVEGTPNKTNVNDVQPREALTSEHSDERSEAVLMPGLHLAPAHIGSLCAPLCAPDRALVLTGSALALGGDFGYLRGALELPKATRELAFDQDRHEQTLLGLPEDVPEPNAARYQRALEEMLVKLGIALSGRIVVLFPSHAALRAAAAGIRRELERHDVLVLAQGQDGSVRQLWHTFGTQPRTVLLGAGGFWSGRDQEGDPAACIVVTRLPFPALSDPLHAARAEQWQDPQAQYVVPQAALKLRQALNSLAWRHDARNAVVLFDRRLQTRGYGQTILGSLPHCSQRQESCGRLVEAITDWID